jgi:hypothetical protein
MVAQTEDEMYEATIGALVNFDTATSAYHGKFYSLTEANDRLAKKL